MKLANPSQCLHIIDITPKEFVNRASGPLEQFLQRCWAALIIFTIIGNVLDAFDKLGIGLENTKNEMKS